MGELTAAIIHELSQPLTSILSNAQAGLRTIQSGRPDRDDATARRDPRPGGRGGHGPRHWAENLPAGGAVFHVALPAIRTEVAD